MSLAAPTRRRSTALAGDCPVSTANTRLNWRGKNLLESTGVEDRPPAGARSGYGTLASMCTIRSRGRRWWLGAAATALFVGLAALLLRSMLEQAVRARI